MYKKNAVKSSIQDFSKSVSADVIRSKFYRPSGLKTTFDAGKLIPIYIDEVLPGDTYDMRIQHVAKMITPLTPTMDNVDLEFFAFFVPNRLVWDNWQKLMGENEDDAWAPTEPPHGVPVFGASNVILENKVGDYYGLPIGMNPSYHNVNILPFRGYRLIWNEWFRNQNIQAPLPVWTGDEDADTTTAGYSVNMELLRVNKPFDYFTACLPEPQKGESQLIPIEMNSLIPVITTTSNMANPGASPSMKLMRESGNVLTGDNILVTTGYNMTTDAALGGQPASDGVKPMNLWADTSRVSEISTSTIADLRTAFQIQKLHERDARGGTRYVEILKSHFGVDAQDYRLQRPEYLGHAKSMVGINQVAQTSETNTTEQGNLTAFAHSEGDDFLFNKSFVEHGFVHIFAVARHKKTYQQGLERFWSRQDRLDYYMPVLAHISEQPVYTKEIFALSNNPTTVFGYQEAWSDYRYKPSKTSGQMRSDNSNSFDIWHYADDYSTAPLLNPTWMQDNSDSNIDRTIAITGAIHQIKMDIRFDLTCIRPLPVNSIPGYIDHF